MLCQQNGILIILKWCCKPTFIRFWEIFRKIRESVIVANISRHGTVFDI